MKIKTNELIIYFLLMLLLLLSIMYMQESRSVSKCIDFYENEVNITSLIELRSAKEMKEKQNTLDIISAIQYMD